MKLILFDIDDTLLTSEKTVSAATAEAIKNCKTKGIIIGYITARSPRKTGLFLEGLPCDCMAYYNGASIYINGVQIVSNCISHDTGIKIMAEIQQAYPKSKISAYLEPYHYFDGEIRNIETKEIKAGDIYALPFHPIQRIRVVSDKEDSMQLEHFMRDDAMFYVTSDGTAIIINKNANKGYAAKKLANAYGIAMGDVISFGDDINDCDMLKASGIGVAMGNATEDAKKCADFVTESNDNNGIAFWLNKYLL